ncbi:hypothetical protein CBM2587_B90259 [Cupriavidus taiwanensis]|uniref:Uncharacterized protein n=1 Tax=Cupriavidus taiwanensis TaxID=164546 RepID=A0A975XED9_9BURK|nr:hypothetical protein CBM2587_B90259 [Cupriavidus taiwanensis]
MQPGRAPQAIALRLAFGRRAVGVDVPGVFVPVGGYGQARALRPRLRRCMHVHHRRPRLHENEQEHGPGETHEVGMQTH